MTWRRSRSRRRAGSRLLASIGSIALAIALPATARAQKTDIVVLSNGDRITCDIKQLQRGKLRVNTDAIAIIEIDWSFVRALVTTKELDIGLRDGRRLYGSLSSQGAEPNESILQTDPPQRLELASIVELVPIHRGFLARLTGSISLGLTTRSATDSIDFHLGFDATQRSRRSQNSLHVDSTLSDQADAGRVNRQLASLTSAHLVTERGQLVGLARLEHNDELGLELRSALGLAYGRYLVQTNVNVLGWLSGLTANREDYGAQTQSTNLEGLLGLDYEVFRFQSPHRANLKLELGVLPSFTSWGRVRSELSVSGRYELVKDFFLGLDAWYSYDNEPPTAEQVGSDWGTSTTIGFSF